MEFSFLKLRPPPPVRLGDAFLTPRLKRLEEITRKLPPPVAISPSRLSDIRKIVRKGFEQDKQFESYTEFSRRESALLHLYLCDLHSLKDMEQLPPFDESVATSLLGRKGGKVKKHLLKQATNLFLFHYGLERIPALKWLAAWLKAGWESLGVNHTHGANTPYAKEIATLFVENAPAEVASQKRQSESIQQLAERFGIPVESQFMHRLIEESLLQRLREMPSSKPDSDLENLIIESKEKVFRTGHPIGSEAIRILIDRSIAEFSENVPPLWVELFLKFACHPEISSLADKGRWWGWATPAQLNVACRALQALTIDQFIELLENSLPDKRQFIRRKILLKRLFEMGKIQNVRIVICDSVFRSLDRDVVRKMAPFRTGGGPQFTSFICLKCTDDVYLIEGTHSFALRGFVGEQRFPIKSFWTMPPRYFDDGYFRIHETQCDIYQVHHQGDWVEDFITKLRRHKNKIEWGTVYFSDRL
jgi:hypothetical protein